MYGWVWVCSWLTGALRFCVCQWDFFLVCLSLLLIFLGFNLDLDLLNWLVSVEAEANIDQFLERRREVTWVVNVEA